MRRLSATTIREWRRCARRYFWRHVVGLETPASDQQKLGTEVHAVLEAHVLGRPTYDFSPVAESIARPAYPILAKIPRTRVEVEKAFAIEVGGVKVTGTIDLAYLGHDHRAYGVDYKTTSDFKWMPANDEISRDPQTILYGKVIRDEVFKKPLGGFRFIYLHKSKPAARELDVDLTDFERSWDRLEVDIQAIASNADRDPGAWTPNTNACGDYGGCPFKSQCGRLGIGPMGFLQKLGASAPTATPAPSPQENEHKDVEPVRFDPTRPPAMSAETERARLIHRLVTAGRDAADMERRNLVELVILAKQLDDPINPPDGTPRSAEVVAPKKAQAQITTLPSGVVVDKAKLDDLLAFFAAKFGVVEQRVDAARKVMSWVVSDLREEATKLITTGESALGKAIEDGIGAKPEKAKKSEVVVTSEAKTEPTETAPPVPPVTVSQELERLGITSQEPASPAPATAPVPTFTIFVNCAPVRGGDIMTLDELVAPIVKDVEKAAGGDAFYGAIDYGKGPALVAAGLQRAIENEEIDLPSELTVDLRERYAPDCLSVLRRVVPQSREFRGFV